MQEILIVLERIHRRESITAISRVTGRSRSTVRRWVEAAEALGWSRESEPDEGLALEVLRRVRPGRALGESETALVLKPHREQVQQWLRPDEPGGRGLRLTKVHELLSRHGVSVPYSSLHRWAVKELGFADRRRITVRMAAVAPGEVAEVDFGRLGLVTVPETGKRKLVHALVVTLVHSRHQYVHVTHSQKLEDLVDGLEDAWAYFGGVPARVILDNLKAAVTKPDRYDPYFQRTFEEYAKHRGFVIDAAPVRTPTGKPHVERAIQYVREAFFRGEQWLDIERVRREALRWCTEVAGQRVHGTTRKRPLEVFESVEKPALRPIVKERFDTPQWAVCKVHPDHHVVFHKALYSVPTRWVGTSVEVRGDRGLVRVYARGELIKTHPRQSPGGRSTDYEDYPPERVAYAMRDPERMIRDARQVGEHAGRFMQELLAGAFPWSRLRQAQKLLRLADRHGSPVVDRACRRALAFSLIDVRRIERIVRQGLDRVGQPMTPSANATVVRPAKFLRPASTFNHHSKDNDDQENNDGNQDLTDTGAQAPSPVGHRPDASRPSQPRAQDQDD